MSAHSRREFTYKDRRYEFEPESLRFRPINVFNQNLEVHFADASEALVRSSSSHLTQNGGVNFATLNVAHDCNMACPYCFAKQGLYGGGERILMDEATARRAVDWLFNQAGEKSEVYLRFLGGEPLMNLRAIKSASLYAEKKAAETGKRIYLSINTNGTLFNSEIAQLIQSHKMTVSISMDGDRAAHNSFRIFRNGTGTYDTVVRNLTRFLECDCYTMINATLTANHLELDEYAALFRSLGVRLVRFAMVGTAIPEIAIAKEEKLARVLAAYDRLAETYRRDLLNGDFWYVADFYKYFDNFCTLEKRHNRCGAGVSYVNIDVNGNVHLCHRFTTDETQLMGHIRSRAVKVPKEILIQNQLGREQMSVPSGPEISKLTGQPSTRSLRVIGQYDGLNSPRVPTHLHRQLDGTPFFEQNYSTQGVQINVCSQCDIRYICGGSCYHDGEILHGDLLGGPDGFKCEVDRHLARIAMWLLDGIYAHDMSILDRLRDLHLRSQQHHAQ